MYRNGCGIIGISAIHSVYAYHVRIKQKKSLFHNFTDYWFVRKRRAAFVVTSRGSRRSWCVVIHSSFAAAAANQQRIFSQNEPRNRQISDSSKVYYWLKFVNANFTVAISLSLANRNDYRLLRSFFFCHNLA